MDLKKILILVVILIAALALYFKQNSTVAHQDEVIIADPAQSMSVAETTSRPTSPNSDEANGGRKPTEIDLPETLLRPPSSLFEPEKLLALHFDRSLNGHIDSAHVVSEVLRFCARMPMTQLDYERSLGMASIPEDIKNLVRVHFPLCAEAKINYPEIFNDQSDYMGSELARQHPLHRMLFKKLSLEERRALVRNLLLSDFEHPFLKGETLKHAGNMFSAWYPENEDAFLRTAIHLAACKYELYCDQPFLIGLLKKEYPPSKYYQLVKLAEQIDNAVNDRDLSLLGL